MGPVYSSASEPRPSAAPSRTSKVLTGRTATVHGSWQLTRRRSGALPSYRRTRRAPWSSISVFASRASLSPFSSMLCTAK